MKRIKSLIKNEEKIYVYFSDTKSCRQFLVDAETEGFKFCDGAKSTSKHTTNIFAVSHDLTICYVGFIGYLDFANSKIIKKVNYAKYRSECSDYIIDENLVPIKAPSYNWYIIFVIIIVEVIIW